jgi:hypothetical protein
MHMAVLGTFRGKASDVGAVLQIYPRHLDITIEVEGKQATVVVAMDEIGSVDVEDVRETTTLTVEDASGVLVASISMDEASASEAKALIDHARPQRSG